MQPRILFLIASDPHSSHRAAEAVRIAAGISSWGKVKTSLCFCGLAISALNDSAGNLVDEEVFTQCLPILAKNECAVYTLPTSSAGSKPVAHETSAISTCEIDIERLGQLTAESMYTLRF